MAAHQAPPSLGFTRQEHWSGLPFPSPMCESEVAQSCLTLSDPMDLSLPDSAIHGIFLARVLEWGATAFSTHHRYSSPTTQFGFTTPIPTSLLKRLICTSFQSRPSPTHTSAFSAWTTSSQSDCPTTGRGFLSVWNVVPRTYIPSAQVTIFRNSSTHC